MIITDGKEFYEIDKNNIYSVEEDIVVGVDESIWCIELFFERKDDKYIRIAKRLPSSNRTGGDEIKSYKIIKDDDNKLLLSKSDYDEIKRLCKNLDNVYKYRNESLIESIAILVAYECYENYYLQELWEVTKDDIFESITNEFEYERECKKLKDKIFKRAEVILEEKYGVKNLI